MMKDWAIGAPHALIMCGFSPTITELIVLDEHVTAFN